MTFDDLEEIKRNRFTHGPRITLTYLPKDVGVVINDDWDQVSIDITIPELVTLMEKCLLIPSVMKQIKQHIELIDYT